MTNEEKYVFDEMEKAESIVFFGHRNPDGDCIGSVMGMKHAMMELFPQKKVYAVGSHPKFIPTFVEPSDDIPDEVIENSLAVMLDVADIERVEDQRILKAPKIVCVDHHVKNRETPFVVYRIEDAPSATYILSKSLVERYGYVPKSAAPYLFMGLVTDSGRFQFDCEPETLRVASLLVESGADYRTIFRDLYRQNSTSLRYRSLIYSSFKFDGLVTYVEVHKEDYLALGMTEGEAGSQVNLLSLLDHHPIWVMFCEQMDGNIRVELRSDGTYNVQKVAIQFGGGGHIPASGCRLDTFDKVQAVVDACNKAEKL